MAGRPKGTRLTKPMQEEWRAKIQKSNILNALVEHTEGRREMTSTQVQAGLGLLRKVLPDMTQAEISGADGGPLQVVINRLAKD